MPEVAGKQFAYTVKGKRAAALYRHKKISSSDGYIKLRKE